MFTWKDFDGRFGEAWHAMLGEELPVPPPLAIADVRHVGEPIALVVADNRYLAEDACELIEVGFEPSDPTLPTWRSGSWCHSSRGTGSTSSPTTAT